MNLKIKNENGKALAVVEGRLDTVSAPEFEKQMKPLMAPGFEEIVMDCTEMSFISSSGLRLFLTLQKQVMANKGNLVLKGIQPDIMKVFDITGFSKIFNIQQ